MRSTTFAVLGLVAAAGLALVAMFALPGWPLLSPAPLPSGPARDTVGEAVALSQPSPDLAGGGYGSALGESVPAPRGGSGIGGETGGRNSDVGVSGPAAVVKAGVGQSPPEADAPAPAPAPETSGESAPAAASLPVASAPASERGSADGSTPAHSTAGSKDTSAEAEASSDDAPGNSESAPGHSSAPNPPGHGGGHPARHAPSPVPPASPAASAGPPSSPPGLSGDHGNAKGHGSS